MCWQNFEMERKMNFPENMLKNKNRKKNQKHEYNPNL